MVPSSLVRHIDALESALGAALFVRSTRGLLLTDAGELLLTRAAALMTDITGLRAELSALNETPQGTLRISCLPTFGKTYVLPLLPTLAERYPQLSVDLDLTERQTDPTQERLDAALRIGEQKDSALYASRIATQRWVMCASPAYVARYGLPADLEALPQHRLIARYHKQQPACWAQILDAALMNRCTMALRCDDFTAQRQAALLGLGIAFCPTGWWGLTCSTGNWCRCWKIRAMSSKASICCARWRRCPPGWRPSPPCCSKPSVSRPTGVSGVTRPRSAGLSLSSFSSTPVSRRWNACSSSQANLNAACG